MMASPLMRRPVLEKIADMAHPDGMRNPFLPSSCIAAPFVAGIRQAAVQFKSELYKIYGSQSIGFEKKYIKFAAQEERKCNNSCK